MTHENKPMRPIPVSAARQIAHKYGYDQVILIARRVGAAPAPHGEHVTTYGINKEHCATAARCGDYLKYRIMLWPRQPSIQQLEDALMRAVQSPGHAGDCSAARGIERDCHCGWREVKELAKGCREARGM